MATTQGTPTRQRLWAALNDKQQIGWHETVRSGYIERLLSNLGRDNSAAYGMQDFLNLCDADDPYDLLAELSQPFNSGIETLTAMHEAAQLVILTLAEALVERCLVTEQPSTPSAPDSGFQPVAVDEALKAYVIAAAWNGLNIKLTYKDGKVHAPGLIDTPLPPEEYKHTSGKDQVKASILALSDAFQAAKPKIEDVGPRFVRGEVTRNFEHRGITLMLAVRATDNTHPLMDVQTRREIHQEFGVWTVQYSSSESKDAGLQTLATELLLLYSKLHLRDNTPKVNDMSKHAQDTHHAAGGLHFHGPTNIGAIGGTQHQIEQANAPGAQAAAGNIVNNDPQLLARLADALLDQAKESHRFEEEMLKGITQTIETIKRHAQSPGPESPGAAQKAWEWLGRVADLKELGAWEELASQMTPWLVSLAAILPK